MKQKKIVVIGGGTGTFTVLSGLKKYPVSLTALVSMSDDGGSTGVLRDELGVLPPGDVRQCLVALSESPLFMRELMNYRFTNGGLVGHAFGNIFLSALEKVSGDFDTAVEQASEILKLRGKVVPVTLSKVSLVAYLKNGKKILGESSIDKAELHDIDLIQLEPKPRPNPKAISAIKEADIIVVGPGDIFTSILPDLIVPGISEAIRKSRAKIVYVCNLMTKKGHTDGWDVKDHTATIEEFIGKRVNFVLYNNALPASSLKKRYSKEGEEIVKFEQKADKNFIGKNLLQKNIVIKVKADKIKRSLVRHDPDTLAKIIIDLFKK